MQVVVEIMTGTIFHVQVGENAMVKDLKIGIHNQENVPSDRLILLMDIGNDHLMINGDEKPLSEYGVQDGSRLYAFFKPLDAKNEDDDVDTGRTESETDEERDDNNNDDGSGSSTPKTPNEDTTVESEYVSTSVSNMYELL
ncbi:unnamed protein product [Withania somnifera]